jgi:hypothetical protein
MDISDRRAHLTGRVAHILSFLRKRRKIVAPQWRTVTTYAELLDARQPSILWLHEPRPLPPNTDLLFPEQANDEIRDRHSSTRQPPGGVGLACLRNAVVSGPSLVGSSSSIYLMAPMMPLFSDQYLLKGDPVGDLRLTKKLKRFIPGMSVLVTYWAHVIYGHWLLEGMPKLLLLRRAARELPPLRFVLPKSLPTWIAKWIALILPSATVEIYDDRLEYVQCERLLLPTMLLSQEHVPHPELATLLEDFRDIVPLGTGPRTRIFVSRIAPNGFRELTNLEELEQIAREEGLTVITPETLSIEQQIAQFSQAELIVGEFASGMHNTLFSPAGARVFCLNWINDLQSRIAQLKRQRVGYLLPSGGVPVTYQLGKPRVDYSIDPRAFRECLRTLNR